MKIKHLKFRAIHHLFSKIGIGGGGSNMRILFCQLKVRMTNFAKTNQNHLNSSVIWIYESHPSFPEFLLPGQASLTVMEKKVIFPSVLVCLLLLLFVIVVNENTPDIHLQFRTEIIIQHTQVALLRGVCGAVRYSVQISSISKKQSLQS